MRGRQRGPPPITSKPRGANSIGSNGKLAIVGAESAAGLDVKLKSTMWQWGGVAGSGVVGGGGGVLGGGCAGNGRGDGVVDLTGLGNDPVLQATVETEVSGGDIPADRLRGPALTRGTHL